jgi:hypothetical protein
MKTVRIDLKNLVNEAPVVDIGTMGDFTKKGGFRREADKRLITNPGRLEKIQKAWEKTPYDFKLYFAQFPGGGRYVETGIPTLEDKADIEHRLGQKLPPEGDDCITVVFTNNSGDKWRAMTPWIIAHRVGHAIWAARRKDREIDLAMKEYERVVKGYLEQLAEAHNLGDHHFAPRTGVQDAYQSQFTRNQGQDKKHRAMAHAFGAMKSARDGNLRNSHEFLHELLAQYLITGTVKLADEHRPVVTHHVYGKPQTRTASGDDQATIEMIKRDFAMEVPTYIENILDRLNGRLLVM